MADDRTDERLELVERLERRGHVENPRTLDALRVVPRHEFVPEGSRRSAYADRPLSIGRGQTISAPHMVGVMADRLDPDPTDRVLEIGTGCGYHAAVTAELLSEGHLYSVEYEPELAERARETLAELGYDDVSVRTGDGHDGWSEHAPYDGAYLTCAPPSVPDAVIEQVEPGGVVVAPVGTGRQRLVTIEKRSDGTVDRTDHGGVRFVTMSGG
ncbi:protein-L-isoaspartate(D-aspartate) O-methyltransferase [Halopelagius inordinatus]|uniref:Protein-L-isoaspartate O-methyltransferase n=1 Tax=Halopelagius inordinatus TaxID=553467 RepID=A0A1I2M9Y7_9EURY|nr:protein-L-isoaspartate O-methyltransferase [Halopelagius inordinatus]SFF86347.1 protein-L-isoaspartate(D-aspartate) O-methyltransferase [Halopelagius inordinatus]